MQTLRSLERKIAKLEGFRVTLRHLDGRDIRGDKGGLPPYPYCKAAKNAFTVAQWRNQRFKQAYAGYDVSVWFANGAEAHGAYKLANVRDSYLDE